MQGMEEPHRDTREMTGKVQRQGAPSCLMMMEATVQRSPVGLRVLN